MTSGIRYGAIAMLTAAMLAGSAHAADAPIVIADARMSTPPRFISLSSARSAQPITRVVNRAPTTQAMRSDRAAMESGFMRIDRARADVVHVPKRVSVTRGTTAASASAASDNDTQLLDLFGDKDITVSPGYGRVSHAWPLPASAAQKFTSAFGMRKDPFSGKPAFHGGIDIAASVGTSILATADGVVTGVGNGRGLGSYVSVKHRDGSESTYGHLSAQSVHIGQKVRQGQKLGELGSTGRSTGPHLDYRIKKGGELINPMTVLKAPAATGIRVASNTPADTARPMNRINHVSTINGVKIIR